MVHGRLLDGRGLRGRHRRRGPARGDRRPRCRRRLQDRPRRLSADPRLLAARGELAEPAAAPHAGGAGRRLAAARDGLDRPLREQIRHVVPDGWAPHPGLRVVACDYSTGRRVPFGREGAPKAELADAVAASCAIPGFYRPVEIDGRLYVDGGIYSTSNLDILRGRDLDLVICLNPTSSLHPIRAWNPIDRIATSWRSAAGRRLGSEAKKLRASGTEVILIQPTGEDMDIMGNNLMSRKRRNEAIETAQRTVARQLNEHAKRSLLDDLPAGRPEKVERPEGDPAEWPDLLELASLPQG